MDELLGAQPSLSTPFVRAVLDLCKLHDGSEVFLRFYGPVPVRPLGLTAERYGEWRSAKMGHEELRETAPSLRSRLSIVNANTPNAGAAQRERFQALAYRAGESLETIVGRDTREIRLGVEQLAEGLASGAQRTFEDLSEPSKGQLLALAERWLVLAEKDRRELWERIRSRVLEKSGQDLQEPNVVAFLATGTEPPRVIRRGDVPELDRLIDERDQLEETLRRRVEAALRR